MLDYFSVGVEHVAGVEVAFNGQSATEKLPGFAVLMVPAFVTSLLAIPVATLSLWRAGLVAWWLVVTAATFLAPNLLPGWLIGFSLMAAGMLAVAWALWRIPEEVWHPRSGSDPVGAADQRAPPPDKGARGGHRLAHPTVRIHRATLPHAGITRKGGHLRPSTRLRLATDHSWCFARDVDPTGPESEPSKRVAAAYGTGGWPPISPPTRSPLFRPPRMVAGCRRAGSGWPARRRTRRR